MSATVGPSTEVPPARPLPITLTPDPLEDLTGDLNPSELDFLARISGSRVDNRPFNLENETMFGSRSSTSSGSRDYTTIYNTYTKQTNKQTINTSKQT